MIPGRLTWLIAALALLAGSIGLGERVFHTRIQAARNPTGERAAPSGSSTSNSAERIDSFLQSQPASSTQIPNKVLRVGNKAPNEPEGSTSDNLPTDGRNNGDQPSLNSDTNMSESEVADVIGRPFSVSESIENACKRDVEELCNHVQKTLKEMAEEPQDLPWAAEMESGLRRQITTTEPGKYSIRAIECRATICAVEVASLFGLYFGPETSDPLHTKVLREANEWSYEVDSSGARITVTLMAFKRR